MPSKKACARIQDPAARRRCLKYSGEFAGGAGATGGAGGEMSRVRKGPRKVRRGRY